MKKLLILGAGEMQLPIIEKAKSLGVYTIVADMNASAVGMQYADRALVVSTMDLDIPNLCGLVLPDHTDSVSAR